MLNDLFWTDDKLNEDILLNRYSANWKMYIQNSTEFNDFDHLKKKYIMVFRNIQWFMDWWFNCVAIEYGYPGENPTLLSRSPASSEIKTTFVIFSHSKTKFRTMAARIGKYSGCSQRRFRLVFCYRVLQICIKKLCEAKFFRIKIGFCVSICF